VAGIKNVIKRLWHLRYRPLSVRAHQALSETMKPSCGWQLLTRRPAAAAAAPRLRRDFVLLPAALWRTDDADIFAYGGNANDSRHAAVHAKLHSVTQRLQSDRTERNCTEVKCRLDVAMDIHGYIHGYYMLAHLLIKLNTYMLRLSIIISCLSFSLFILSFVYGTESNECNISTLLFS